VPVRKTSQPGQLTVGPDLGSGGDDGSAFRGASCGSPDRRRLSGRPVYRTVVGPLEDCRFALAAATQVIAYHFIIDGRLILTVEGEPPL
jgi:hypothetical protein